MNEISLKEYIDRRFEDTTKAVDIAREAIDKRLEGMNEFRDQLKDQASRFITRDKYEAKHETLVNQLNSTQKLIWTGLGILIGIQLVLKFFIK